MRWVTLIALLLCGGCVTRPAYIATQIELPPEPELPVVFATELQCLNETTYETLVRREARLKGHIAVLRAIIEEHNKSE